jgi:hypothetical protein
MTYFDDDATQQHDDEQQLLRVTQIYNQIHNQQKRKRVHHLYRWHP